MISIRKIVSVAFGALLVCALVACDSDLKDPRDGRVYKTVKIGSQVWMAENLDYETEESYCFRDNPIFCTAQGRLYTLDAARKACPAGWRLPTYDDFNDLISAAGGPDSAGTKLKSKTGWQKRRGKDCNGTDDFGFNAVPAGYRASNGKYYDDGGYARFRGTTISLQEKFAFTMALHPQLKAEQFAMNKEFAFSVRCIKNR